MTGHVYQTLIIIKLKINILTKTCYILQMRIKSCGKALSKTSSRKEVYCGKVLFILLQQRSIYPTSATNMSSGEVS